MPLVRRGGGRLSVGMRVGGRVGVGVVVGRSDLLPPKYGEGDLDPTIAAIDEIAVEEKPIRWRRETKPEWVNGWSR